MEIRDRKWRRDRQREGYEDELTMGRIGLELDVRLGQVLASLEDAWWSQAGCECRRVFGEYVQRSRRHRTVLRANERIGYA